MKTNMRAKERDHAAGPITVWEHERCVVRGLADGKVVAVWTFEEAGHAAQFAAACHRSARFCDGRLHE